MDDERCRQFFLQPQDTFHRRYVAFRAYFLDGQPLTEIADRFGYRLSSLKSLLCRFRASCAHGAPSPFFFPMAAAALSADAAVQTKTAPNRPPSRTPDCSAWRPVAGCAPGSPASSCSSLSWAACALTTW